MYNKSHSAYNGSVGDTDGKTMTTTFYIHGYGSSVDSLTATSLREYIPELKALTYDHNTPSLSVIGMIREIVKTAGDDDVVIIGSSLGGWYTNEIAKHIICDIILYNPATEPWETLARYGVKKDALDEYRRVAKTTMAFTPSVRRHVILSTDDEIIPYEKAAEYFKGKASITYTTGGHRSTDESIKIISERVTLLENSF